MVLQHYQQSLTVKILDDPRPEVLKAAQASRPLFSSHLLTSDISHPLKGKHPETVDSGHVLMIKHCYEVH